MLFVLGDQIYVREVDAASLRKRRERLRLTKTESARRMYEHLESTGLMSRDGLVVTGPMGSWATERACRRAIDDLEGGRKVFKEAQYVTALLTILGLEFADVGLDPDEPS